MGVQQTIMLDEAGGKKEEESAKGNLKVDQISEHASRIVTS
jgi:hypothetical protein